MSAPVCEELNIGGDEEGSVENGCDAATGMLPVKPAAMFGETGFMAGEEEAVIALKAARASFELLRVL
jgi:hypothetical protein